MQKYANLVELEKCCRTHIFLQNFVLIQPRKSPPKICNGVLFLTPRGAGRAWPSSTAPLRHSGARHGHDEALHQARGAERAPVRRPLQPPARVGSGVRVSKIGKIISKFLQIFGGLVLGCIKTKFCKKICVRQHFSRSTRFSYFCNAAISKI